jgi:hypothetical protein
VDATLCPQAFCYIMAQGNKITSASRLVQTEAVTRAV